MLLRNKMKVGWRYKVGTAQLVLQIPCGEEKAELQKCKG